MKDPSLALRTAYFSALNGNVTYNSAVVPVFDHVPQAQDFPYIVLSNQTNTDDSDKEDFGTDHTILIEVVTGYSKDYTAGGFKAADTIGSSILQLVIVEGSHLDLSASGFNNFYENLTLSENFPENTATHKVFRKIMRIRHYIQEL